MQLNRQGAHERDERSALIEEIMEKYSAMSEEQQEDFFRNLKRKKIKKIILGSEEPMFSP